MTTFTPILDRIIIKEKKITMDYGALILPDLGKERVMTGEVIAVGPGLISPFTGARTAPQCTIGDIILYPINNATQINHDFEDYYIIKETEIYTILNKNEE